MLRPGPSDLVAFDSLRDAAARLDAVGCDDGLRLVRAAIVRFLSHHSQVLALADDDPRLRFELRYETDVPRQVGLAGSSAIVTATLRALCTWFDTPIVPADAAELAWAAELQDLRIACGAMDRVIQSYEGVVLMDLAEPRTPASYVRLDPDLLPPLFVAFDRRGGEASSRAHGDLRTRWERGDTKVHTVMRRLRDLVDEGLRCLQVADHSGFGTLVRENFGLRSQIYPVAERDRQMVSIADCHGLPAKLCGSGGAVVGVLDTPALPPDLVDAYAHEGFTALVPEIRGPRA